MVVPKVGKCGKCGKSVEYFPKSCGSLLWNGELAQDVGT